MIIHDCRNALCKTPLYTGSCNKECIKRWEREMGVKHSDLVEVVRCKKCKQWSRNVGIVDSPNGHCFYHDIETNGFDFCSYGERRSKEE